MICAYRKCGKEFTQGRRNQVFHSQKCREAAKSDRMTTIKVPRDPDAINAVKQTLRRVAKKQSGVSRLRRVKPKPQSWNELIAELEMKIIRLKIRVDTATFELNSARMMKVSGKPYTWPLPRLFPHICPACTREETHHTIDVGCRLESGNEELFSQCIGGEDVERSNILQFSQNRRFTG